MFWGSILATIYFLRRNVSSMGGSQGIFSFGKGKHKRFNKEMNINISFKDVAGMDEAKFEIMEFVDFLKTPSRYTKLGAKIPKVKKKIYPILLGFLPFCFRVLS